MERDRKFFVAKHDLQSFLAWPGVIWRTGEIEFPRALRKMQPGDRWIEFAYVNDESRRERVQQVLGFYQCISLPTKRVLVPPKPRALCPRSKWAWAIQGRAVRGWQPSYPVTVPSLNRLLGRTCFGPETLTPIKEDEFELIRRRVREFALDPSHIPLLNRDPRNEQEVVGILLSTHRQLGIEKIDRIQCRFPDLRVKLAGKKELVHLEVETYSSSYFQHRHHLQVRNCVLKTDDRTERLPVAVLCWNDDEKAKGGELAQRVHKVYELRELLQRRAKIRWGRNQVAASSR